MKIPITILMVLATIVGCTSFKTTQGQSTEVVIAELAVGDTVEIVTADAEKQRFTITAIEDDALIGKDVRVPKADFRIVSVETIDAGKTAAAAAGGSAAIVVGILMLVGVAVLAGGL